MANATPTRVGQVNGAGDTDALFLKLFAGEVLTAYWAKNQFLSRHMVRTISNGKSASFPASWKGGAQYHTPGAEIVGTKVNHNERVITVDDLLIADRFIPLIDEAKNHYDVRSIYSKDVGAALAAQFDKNVAQVVLLAARASATVTGGDGGTVVTSANSKTDADTLVAAVFDAVQALDEKNVPEEDRFVALKPDQYYMLVNSSSKLINRDYGNEGNGSHASGLVMRIAGAEIVKTNQLPTTEVADGPTNYQGDFSTTTAAVWQKGAAGTVKLIDLGVEMEYDIRRQGTLIVAKYAVGHGILRPECAVEIKTA